MNEATPVVVSGFVDEQIDVGINGMTLFCSTPPSCTRFNELVAYGIPLIIEEMQDRLNALAEELCPRPGSICESCFDAPAMHTQEAPWGGEMGVCTQCKNKTLCPFILDGVSK